MELPASFDNLSPRARRYAGDLLESDPLSPAELRLRVQRHVARLERAAAKGDLVPVGRGQRTAARIFALIDELDPDTRPGDAALVGVAARYFGSGADDSDDEHSMWGLDDDVAVLAAVTEALAERRATRRG